MARALVVRTVLMMAVLGVAAAASSSPGTRESVREILGVRHPVTMTAEDWRKLGSDVDVYLIEAAADSALRYGVRQRAMSGLAAVGGPRAKEFLRDTIQGSRVAPELLSTAVQAYAKGFAKSDPDDVRLLSVQLLDHVDWVVRQGAVRGLGELGTKEASEALRLRQSRETHPAVQSALRKALGQPESGKR